MITEEVMRSLFVALGVAGVAGMLFVQPAAAAKTKMGCVIGKEVWDASQGKCVAGKPKHSRMAKASKKGGKK
jgi:hypothetical protein